MSLAQITLIGNIGRDPEMSYTPDGVPVTKFSIAISNGKGEKQTTTWYNVTAWRRTAEILNECVKKGERFFLIGELTVRQYTTRDGKPGTSLDVTVDKFHFLGGKAPDAEGEAREHANAGAIGNGEVPF